MNPGYATLTTDGTFQEFSGKPTYEVLRDGVGGLIEAVDLRGYPGDPTMWVNEEGKFTEQVNPLATRLGLATRSIWDNDYIAGNVVFTGGVDRFGNTKPLSIQTTRALRAWLLLVAKEK